MRKFRRFDSIVSRAEEGVMLVSYVVLIVLVGFEALRRSVTGEQWLAGPDVALYAFVWLSWFAMSKNVRDDTHLSFRVFRDKMSCKTRAFFESIDCVIWLVLGAIVISTSLDVVQRHISFGQTVFGTNIPLWAASIAVPVGWAFTMVRIGQRLYGIVTNRTDLFSVNQINAAPQELL